MLETSRQNKVSLYNPSQDVKDMTKIVRGEYEDGMEILQRPFVELNDMSVIARDDRDQRTFNAFVDENIEDPDEAWKWRGTRSKARNKAIVMHAKLTAGYIIPMFMAQNKDDEVDEAFSNLMQDGVEWMINNSQYKSSYLKATMGMLVNCVTYMGAEYAEVFQTIKEKTDNGYVDKEVLDEELSGFQAPVYSSDQILISNPYEQNIQRQRTVIKRRWIDYSDAQALYGDHEDFQFVSPGVNITFNSEDGQFYETVDDDHPTIVEEVTRLNRLGDSEITYVGGVYMGSSDVEGNPIKHRDNRNRPKYNITPFGYQRVNEHFYFYKSLMNAQYWDNQLLDATYEVGMNRMFLDANMPVAVSGSDEIDSEIIFPSSVVAFADKDTKVNPLLPAANLNNIFGAMSNIEKSMDESSSSDVSGGQLPDGDPKATALNIAEKNARIMISAVGKTLAESIVGIGDLMADIFLNHITIPQVDEIVGETSRLRYRTLTLKNKNVRGKSVDKVIKFDDTMLGKTYTKKELRKENIKMAMESGYPNNKSVIMRVNPELCAQYRYLAYVEPEFMFPRNQEYEQAMSMQLMTVFQNNPYASFEAITHEALRSFYRDRADEFKVKPKEQPQQQEQQQTSPQAKIPQTQMGQMTQNNILAKELA